MQHSSAGRPNIVYIHSHDTGRYVQPYGHAIQTPAIQRLAEQGVLFRQAFCVNPTCSPSRAALLTGRWPHQNGMVGLLHRGASLNEPRHCLPWTLKGAGYTTAVFGIQHVADDESLLGYDEIDQTYEDEQVAANAVQFIQRDHAQPFFLSVGFFQTHRFTQRWHNDSPKPLGDARYVRPPAPLPDTPDTRQDFADFAVAATRLDQCIGSVFDALDQAGLAENTLVICTTDHGIAFPGMKGHLTDHGMGVMLVMRGPGGFTGGQVCDAMVTHMDLYPTVCDLLDIEPPAWLEGKSLRPLVQGQAQQLHEALFAQTNYHAHYEPARAVRTTRYKYIRRFDGASHPADNTDESVSKDLWMNHGWHERLPATEQLYDLVFDPHETDNLVVGGRAPEVLAEMRQRLDAWMRDTDDPLATPDGAERLADYDYRVGT